MKLLDWFNRHLIPDWKHPFRFHSIKGITVGMIFTAASAAVALWYGSEDASQHALYPRWLTHLIFFIILIGCFIGRLWKQGDKDGN